MSKCNECFHNRSRGKKFVPTAWSRCDTCKHNPDDPRVNDNFEKDLHRDEDVNDKCPASSSGKHCHCVMNGRSQTCCYCGTNSSHKS